MAAETLAVSTAFDAAFTLRHQLTKMLGRHMLLLLMTDSRSLFKVIVNHKKTHMPTQHLGSISTFSICCRQVMCPCHSQSWMLNLFTWWSMPMLLTLIVKMEAVSFVIRVLAVLLV
jgi:hypothetical protein